MGTGMNNTASPTIAHTSEDMSSVRLKPESYRRKTDRLRAFPMAGHLTRKLTVRDIPELRRLELEKWGAEAATEAMLQSRITHHPNGCWGTFDHAEHILSSCFFMALPESRILSSRSWHETTDGGMATGHTPGAKAWFGISLAAVDGAATNALIADLGIEMWRHGVRRVYLGAPMPGYTAWKRKHPDGSPETYAIAYRKRRGRLEHIDPLLCYYTQLGFEVVQVLPNYFPHEKSEDYGALLALTNRLWFLWPLLHWIPRYGLQFAFHLLAKLT